MIHFKMHAGTATEEDVCLTCVRLHKMRLKTNEEIKICTYTDKRLTNKVVECNKHIPANLPSLRLMQDISWNLRTDKKGSSIGFASPSETSRLVKEGKMDAPIYIDD